MQSKEPQYNTVIWYKVGRNRQRWFYLGVGSLPYASVALAEEVARWSDKPNTQVVGTMQERDA
jgi:hypothetical protein